MRPALLSVLLLTLPLTATAAQAAGSRTSAPVERPIPTVFGPGNVLTSGGTALAARETAGPDTFTIYGGPDQPTVGKFQMTEPAIPDWGGGNGLPGGYDGGAPGAWTPVDETHKPNYWSVDDFNAANLNHNGPGNRAMWCGLDAGDPRTANWASPPGYGNAWDEALVYESAPVANTTIGQVVSLDFWFNHESEPTYDYFSVEYDSAGVWTRVMEIDSTNKVLGVFGAPGVRFSDVSTQPIRFVGNDYGGENFDQIRIRLRFTSDGGFSDQDVHLDTAAGAVQADDISLVTSLGSFFEDFEGAGPYLFKPQQSAFAGDFAGVYSLLTNIDPCRNNPTGVLAFLDVGQIIRNGPSPDGLTSTGGSTSPGSDYGVPGGFVVNYTGGLSYGQVAVTNEVESPQFPWDLPGPGDDGAEYSGARLSFDVWKDLPLTNGLFYVWSIRSALAGQEPAQWRNRNFVYYGGGNYYTGVPGWARHVEIVSDLVQSQPEFVQIRLACWDYADVFGFPGNTATPSPWFDNVRFDKIRITGPAIATRDIDLAQDGFPISGSIDVSTQLARDALDVPFSMARDVDHGDIFNDPGDSVIFDVHTVIPSTAITDIRMVWALNTNPLFEDAVRSAPSGPVDENVTSGPAGTVWEGEVVAQQSKTSGGAVVAGRYFVDLPDVDFMYPGDVLHYYIQATDDGGRVSTLPTDLSGFGDFSLTTQFNRTFQVRALPTLIDDTGTQPPILVYNEYGRPGSEAEWKSALSQLGFQEGTGHDTYTVLGATSNVSNGIGSAGAHGAASAQLAGYHHIFHFAGTIGYRILSDGNGGWGGGDKGNDVGTLRGWLDSPGLRNIAHFGDGIASGNVEYPIPSLYVEEVMGINLLNVAVAGAIGGQTAPGVVPNPASAYAGSLSSPYLAYGGCLQLNSFDQVQPLPGAEAGHYFTDTNGLAITSPGAGVASVINPHTNGLVITFPYGVSSVRNLVNRSVGFSARAQLFQEVLTVFGAGGAIVPTAAAPGVRAAQLSVAPNPFNPVTTIEFSATIGSRGSVKIYNLRGELVRTLHQGEFSGTTFTWDGVDDRGASVASGVYVVRGEDGSVSRTSKVALVK